MRILVVFDIILFCFIILEPKLRYNFLLLEILQTLKQKEIGLLDEFMLPVVKQVLN